MKISFLHILPISLLLSILPFFKDVSNIILVFNILILIYASRIKSRWIKIALVFVNIILIIKIYGFHMTQDISIVLLISMLCLKLLEIKSISDKRNILLIIYLQFFLIACSFLNSQTIWLTIYNFTLVFCLSFLMMIFSNTLISQKVYSFKGLISSKNNSKSVLAGFRQTYQLNLKIILLALPLMMVLFLLFPRIPGPLWSLPNLSQQGTTGLSDTMFPGSVNQLSDSTEIVFRIDFKGAIPTASKLYWRGPVLSQTDGFLWQQSDASADALKGSFSDIIKNIDKAIDYSISLEPQKQKWLFTLEMPQSIKSQFIKDAYLSQDMQFLVNDRINQVVQYQVRSYTVFTFTANSKPTKKIQNALKYPLATNPKTWKLGQQWKNSLHQPQQIINRALDYFVEQGFFYTRKPALMADNPADEFLFKYQRGFCEHFASSFVLLMRAAGIPARVVTGYQGMEFNKLGGYYLVRQSNAHAWAEVWLKDKGWVRVDPTAIIPQDHIEEDIFDYKQGEFSFLNLNYSDMIKLKNKVNQNNWIKQAIKTATQSIDIIQYSWNKWVLAYDQNKQKGLLSWLGLSTHWEYLVLLLVVIPIGVVIIITYFQLYRKNQTKDQLLHTYHQFLKHLQQKGLTISFHDGPQLLKQQSIAKFPAAEQQLEKIFNYYIHLRYSKACKGYSIKVFKQLLKKIKKINIRACLY